MPTDLILLVADKNIEHSVRGLLGRPQALGIRPLSWRIYVHPQRDPACAQKSHEFLRQFSRDYDRALVVFDHRGCGLESRIPTEVEEAVRQLLSANGWDNRANAVVIAPELEAWVFSASPQVETCLSWSGPPPLRQWLEARGLWVQQHRKPTDPKTAFETALAKLRRPRSSAIRNSGQCCWLRPMPGPPAFNRFRIVLQTWFPPTEHRERSQSGADPYLPLNQ
jgi:hypothetical protein